MQVEPAACSSATKTIESRKSILEQISEPTEWHLQFEIPELKSFSQHVRNAVDSGIVTGRARREIVQVLRTYMTAHTVYPTSEQYKTVSKKLITKFPSLKDSEGTSKYVSAYNYFE